MAAGAAHEINTPLAVISGRAQLMGAKATDVKERQTWQLVAAQAQRISDTISDLMTFAVPAEPNPAAFDVGPMLQEAANSFSQSDPPQVVTTAVDITTGPDLPRIRADEAQIRSVIVELLTNAAAAGPQKPLTLAAEFDEISRSVLVKVSDRGCGMDPPTLEQAFTPFFSSQQAGRRRGLGLPRAKRYVENNGGKIWIQSQPNHGTCVTVQLPAAP